MTTDSQQAATGKWQSLAPSIGRWLLILLPFLVYALLWLARAGNSPFWSDEILSFFMCGKADVPLGTVWHGIWQGRDGMFPAFYLCHYLWGATLQPLAAQLLAGIAAYPQEAAWRLPSLLFALAGSAALLWQLAIRYGLTIAVAAVSVLLLGSNQLTVHAGGFRCYGMLIGLSALLVALLLARENKQTRWQLPALALCALALTFTHLFGILYVFVCCLGYYIAVRGTPRTWLTLGVTALPAALMLLAYLPAVLNMRRMETPWSWRQPPVLEMLPDGFLVIGLNPWLPIVLALIVIIAIAGKSKWEPSARPSPVALWIAATLLAVPPAVWLLSQFTTPVFLNRYFLPVAIAYGLLTAAVVPRIGGRLAALVLSILLGIAGLAGIPQPSSAPPSAMEPLYPLSRSDWQQPALFHITDSSHLFMQQLFYEKNSAVRHFFLYDKDKAYDPNSDAPRRLASEINQVAVQSETWQDTNKKNGVPSELLLPVEEAEGFASYLPAKMQLVVSRSLDLKAGENFNKLLLNLGWHPATRYIIPAPAGSIDSGIERTVWRRPQSQPENRE